MGKAVVGDKRTPFFFKFVLHILYYWRGEFCSERVLRVRVQGDGGGGGGCKG